jgi:hypothetical protein
MISLVIHRMNVVVLGRPGADDIPGPSTTSTISAITEFTFTPLVQRLLRLAENLTPGNRSTHRGSDTRPQKRHQFFVANLVHIGVGCEDTASNCASVR